MGNIVTVAQPHPTLCLTFTRMLYSNDCHTCLSWRHSGSPLTPTIPAVTLRDNGCKCPIRMRVTLPNLRWLGFKGTSAYLETLPHIQPLMSTTGNVRLNTIALTFRKEHLFVIAYPHKGARMLTLSMELSGRHLDWQVASTAQDLHTLRTVFFAVKYYICNVAHLLCFSSGFFIVSVGVPSWVA